MEFQIQSRKKNHLSKYSKQDIEIVYEFSKLAKRELGQMLRGIMLFGSTARKIHDNQGKSHDIDILMVVDDVTINLTPELIQTYRILVEKIIIKVSRKLHVTTLRLTNFWEYVRVGDPIAINILRDGVPIIDTGFFEPLQILLYQGRIRPSAESIQNYMAMAPQTLQNSRAHIVQGTLDLYWAVIDSAHAALMHVNEIPPSPSHVADLMDERLIKTGLIPKRYSGVMRRFYALGKSIMHGELNYMSGDQFDAHYKEAQDFVSTMKKFIEKK